MKKTLGRRITDSPKGSRGELHVLQSVNAPVSLFQTYREIAMAKYGNASKRQYLFRQALTEYLDNHQNEFENVLTNWRKARAV